MVSVPLPALPFPGAGRAKNRQYDSYQAPCDCTLYFDHTLLCRWSGRKYGVMLEGCMGQRYSTQLGGSKNLTDVKDHFSSNRQPRCEQIYINCSLLFKDNLRTLRSRRGPTTKTNTADRYAHSRRLDRVVRIVAGMENKKMTHQRLRITCEQG